MLQILTSLSKFSNSLFSYPLNYLIRTYNEFDSKSLILEQHYYSLFMLSFIFWFLTFAIVYMLPISHKNKETTNDTKTRIISILHASLIFWWSFYDVQFNQTGECGQSNSKFQNYLLVISCAYFLYDTIVCLLLGVLEKEMVYHHVFCILGYYFGLVYNNSANEMLRGLVVGELACPIMHLRKILTNYELRHTKSYFVLDMIYMTAYLTVRIGLGLQAAMFNLFCWDNLLIVKVSGTFIWVQSCVFAKRMWAMIGWRIGERKERKAKNVQLFWFSHNKKLEELDYFQKMLSRKTYVP